jgi:acyl-[acyl-carrier-protein]-phospholipid O-acyltransferase/long-chain-fatty-acid--[acyl-carrier-protein] ligase
VRITHPDTELPVPVHDTGMIWLSGANIFRGYLNAPEKTADVIQGQWFKTGDIGRLDEDGFLYIEGRLSRFSKIGGEMVPHETVESYLNNALEFGSSDERKLAVTGIPDDAKGEALVMLVTEKELDFESLRKHLISEGVPALWVPKKWLYVESIPTLASGKLDIRGCQDLAAEA